MRAQRIGWLALAVALLAAGAALLPLEPMFLSFMVDGAFGATLHFEAAMRGRGEALHLISTYGPLGFVYYPLYLPDTYQRLLLAQGLFGAVLCWSLAWLGWAGWGTAWGAALAIALSAPFLNPPDVRFWLLAASLVLIELPRRQPAPAALRFALGAAVGVAGLVKVTFLADLCVALAPLVLGAVLVRRRLPLAAVGAVVALPIAWLGLGLGWADWLGYLDWSLREIAPGYSAAMQLPTGAWLVAHALAASGAVLATGTWLARRTQRADWWAAALALAGLLFALFKAGFVRADVHIFITVYGLVVCAALLTILSGPLPWRTALRPALMLLVVGSLLVHAVALRGAPQSVLFAAATPPAVLARLRRLPGALLNDAFAPMHAASAAAIRQAVPLQRAGVSGAFDVYSFQQGVLLANGVDFRPRPVFQSYMAYTPRLAHANAEHLVGAPAPQAILFQPTTIDGRFPALDDAPSLLELLTRYQPLGLVEHFVVLQRRDAPLTWRLLPLDRFATATDAPIPVPPGPIWARIDVHESVADRLLGAFFASPSVSMAVTFASGATATYRLLPALARDGFLLSPVVAATRDALPLFQRRFDALAPRAVRSIALQMQSPFGDRWGRRPVDVELFQLAIAPE